MPYRGWHLGAIDHQDDKIVSVAVDALGHAAKLVAQRAVNKALALQRDTAGGHPVITCLDSVQPHGALGDVEQLRRIRTVAARVKTYSAGTLTTIASWVDRAITTTASVSGDGFSSRCGTCGGTQT